MRQLFLFSACISITFCFCVQTSAASQPMPWQATPSIRPDTSATAAEEPFDPIETLLFESPSQALSTWSQFRASKPTLVLLSQDPFLQPLPAPLHKDVNRLILQGSAEELIDKTATTNPNLLLLPSMTVSSALRADLFSNVVWVFPSKVANEDLDVDLFRQQMLNLAAINPQEAEGLTKIDGGIGGAIRGLPFQAVTIDTLPDIQGPTLLHIDLEYFKPLYKGEIKTKLYALLYRTIAKLRSKHWDISTASISYSNMNGTLPLSVRFIGPVLATLMKRPEMLNQPLPLYWQRHSNALFLPNFMKTEEELDVYLKIDKDLPDDPSIKYGLYQVSRQLKDGSKALNYLAQAVELDAVYALEYLYLARIAKEKGRPDQSLRMIQLAVEAMPDNPFILQQLATSLNQIGHSDQAIELLEKLLKLTWSEVYYPGILERLSAQIAVIREKASQ